MVLSTKLFKQISLACAYKSISGLLKGTLTNSTSIEANLVQGITSEAMQFSRIFKFSTHYNALFSVWLNSTDMYIIAENKCVSKIIDTKTL